MGFTAKSSSGLSQASIFGAASGATLLNVFHRHPEDTHATWKGKRILEHPTAYTRPLIDYSMLLFLAPMEMAGAALGVLIQQTLPNWLYLSLAAIVLCMVAVLSFVTYRSMREKELREQTMCLPQRLSSSSANVLNMMTIVMKSMKRYQPEILWQKTQKLLPHKFLFYRVTQSKFRCKR